MTHEMMSQLHWMLDLETLGTSPDAVIVAIGVAEFVPATGDLIRGFYQPIDIADSMRYGSVDTGTLKWWLAQAEAARAVFVDPGAVPLTEAVTQLRDWLDVSSAPALVWGNGASFDNVIFSSMLRNTNQPLVWSYRADACYRTLKNLFPEISMVRTGTHHNALDDAVSQAAHCAKILQRMFPPATGTI